MPRDLLSIIIAEFIGESVEACLHSRRGCYRFSLAPLQLLACLSLSLFPSVCASFLYHVADVTIWILLLLEGQFVRKSIGISMVGSRVFDSDARDIWLADTIMADTVVNN